MGYYTSYNLTATKYSPNGRLVKPTVEEEELISKRLDALEVFEAGNNVFNGLYAWAKWYDYEEDMREISCEFPGIFSLYMETVKIAMICG